MEMGKKQGTKQSHGEKIVNDIRQATRKQYSVAEKIRIVLDGLILKLDRVATGGRFESSREDIEPERTAACIRTVG